MGREIERKFLVVDDGWRAGGAAGVAVRQGYLSRDPERIVRVRTRGERGFLTIKGRGTGLVRPEFEYEIPAADARDLLDLCTGAIIEKTRYHVLVHEAVWEVDEFHGENAGLVLAEIELAAPEQAVVLPPWAGDEVTGDSRYANASLATLPFRRWPSRRSPNG